MQQERAYRLDKVDYIVRKIFLALTWFAVFAVAFVMLSTTCDILSRIFLRHSINGVTQLCEALMVCLSMSALPIVTMYNTHIKVDIVYMRSGKKFQYFMTFFNLILCSAIMIICGIYTFAKADQARMVGISFDVPPIPHWIIYEVIAVFFVASGVCAAYNIFHYAVTRTIIGPETFAQVRDRIKALKRTGTQEADVSVDAEGQTEQTTEAQTTENKETIKDTSQKKSENEKEEDKQ